MDGLNKIV